jgi:hypothetical protein
VFALDAAFLPRPSLLSWSGSIVLAIDGEWKEFGIHNNSKFLIHKVQ